LLAGLFPTLFDFAVSAGNTAVAFGFLVIVTFRFDRGSDQFISTTGDNDKGFLAAAGFL